MTGRNASTLVTLLTLTWVCLCSSTVVLLHGMRNEAPSLLLSAAVCMDVAIATPISPHRVGFLYHWPPAPPAQGFAVPPSARAIQDVAETSEGTAAMREALKFFSFFFHVFDKAGDW